jgi:peroxiredoxin
LTAILTTLPDNLPQPIDDGACCHLIDKQLPQLELSATSGVAVNLAKLSGWLVIFGYPLTGQPDKPLPEDWDSIPGARGCTPQSCAFRDHHQELLKLGAQVFGLSAQSTEYQQEASKRLNLPYHF